MLFTGCTLTSPLGSKSSVWVTCVWNLCCPPGATIQLFPPPSVDLLQPRAGEVGICWYSLAAEPTENRPSVLGSWGRCQLSLCCRAHCISSPAEQPVRERTALSHSDPPDITGDTDREVGSSRLLLTAQCRPSSAQSPGTWER